MGRSKVSMVVPCYNKRDYIVAFLKSVHSQIWDDIELILVNDGSTDGTREIIAEWEPSLRARGYDVIIIDQENLGIAMAVKHGLLRASGDYVCAPDCDDELYPDYVSAMAEYLETRPELGWCFCDFDVNYVAQGVVRGPKEHRLDSSDMGALTLDAFAADGFCRAVWRLFMRRQCLLELKIAENIPLTEQRITHEAYIGMPLIAAGGYGHIEKALYKYYVEIPALTNITDPEKRIDYYNTYFEAISYTLGKLDLPESERRRLFALAELRRDYEVMAVKLGSAENAGTARRAVSGVENSINIFFAEYKGIAPFGTGELESMLVDAKVPSGALWTALCYAIGVKKGCDEDISRISGKRVIAYGALGKAAVSRLPNLMATSFKPSLLWDNGARPDDTLCGMPVLKPEPDTLTDDDLLLVFPKNETVVSEVKAALSGTRATVLYHEDIRRHEWVFFFPSLWSLEKMSGGKAVPLVSIVIPVYNGANYLREAIDSALIQTYNNIEVIVVNDGSNDGGATENIVLSYGDKIRYFSKPNGGVSTALNLGIEKMRGEYFSWLSHDDLYLPDKISAQIEALRACGDMTKLVYCGTVSFRENGTETFSEHSGYSSEILTTSVLPVIRSLVSICALLIHKSHFNRVGVFDPALRTTQDYDLAFRLFNRQKVIYLDKYLVKTRWHTEQGIHTIAEHIENETALWRGFADRLTEDELNALPGGAFWYYYCIRRVLVYNSDKDGVAYIDSKLSKTDKPEEFCARLRKLDEYISALSGGRASKLAIFCAGKVGIHFCKTLKYGFVRVDAFGDNDTRKHGRIFAGVRCISRSELKEQKDDTLVIVAAKEPDEILSQLRTDGFPFVAAHETLNKILKDIASLKSV